MSQIENISTQKATPANSEELTHQVNAGVIDDNDNIGIIPPCSNFKKLNGKDLSAAVELTFKDGKSTKTKKLFLCHHSNYFCEKIISHPNEDKFNVLGITLEEFECYQEFISKAKGFDWNEENIYKLINAQCYLDSDYLELSIEECFENNSNFSYLLNVYKYLNNTHLSILTEKIKHIIHNNLEEVCKHNTFNSVSYKNLIDLFLKELSSKENAIICLDLFTKWVKHEFQNRKAQWIKLLKEIDFKCIERDYILNEYVPNNDNVNNEHVPNNDNVNYVLDVASFLLNVVGRSKIIPQCLDNVSKIILFGGHNTQQSIISIDPNDLSKVKKIGKLNNKWKWHTSERINETAFLFGGYYNTTMETFDITTDICTTLTCGMSSKFNYASSAVIGNKIFRIGGYCEETKETKSVEYFEPEKFAWYSLEPLCKPVSLCKSVSKHNSVVIDDIIYVTPGEGCADMQIYDPRVGKFVIPKEQNSIVTTFSAASTFGENILCCGGTKKKGEKKEIIASCRIFDTRNHKWRDAKELPQGLSEGSLVELKDKVMYLGGWDNGATGIHVYSKSENSWKEFENVFQTSHNFSTITF